MVNIQHLLRSQPLETEPLHVPTDLALELLCADLLAASAPTEIVLVFAASHDDVVQRVLVSMGRVLAAGRLDVCAANVVMRPIGGEAVLSNWQ